jgi:hypothetical protein
MYNREGSMDYYQFTAMLDNNVLPSVNKLRIRYLKHIDCDKRVCYQSGKVVEEVGEFLQAIAEENGCRGSFSYPDIRGTVESEAADVVLSTLVLSLLTGEKPYSVRYSTPVLSDTWVIATRLLECASRQDVRRVISTLFFYCELHGIDLYAHVVARLRFNLKEMQGV